MAFDKAFVAVSALLFAICVTVTTIWSASMSAMSGMPMPGGWVMSMMWMRMGGGTWPNAAGSFLAMWVVMMGTMMLPVLVPMLWRYRKASRGAVATRIGLLTALAALAYFAVWIALGLVVFLPGVALAEAAMRETALSRAVPITAGAAVLIAGAIQLTPWKAHVLACCRETPVLASTGAADALRYGLRLGLLCIRCCANLMAVLLAVGMMDFGTMAAVTAAVTIERLAPASERLARVIGIITIGAGLVLIARAVEMN